MIKLSKSTTFPLLIFFVACSPASLSRVKANIELNPTRAHFLSEVPFFSQKDHYCGPAALASILNFYDKELSQEDIAKSVYLPQVKGALNIDLLLYAREQGFEAKILNGDLERLKKEIARGHPLIIFLDLGWCFYPVRHYAVAVGYDDIQQVVIVHSGKKENQLISYKKFQKAWKKTGNWCLLILPRQDKP
ncbi:MAG: PA2778 family cysteine peptidase [Deltaproteobacteria bacterium]|nr:MAG: PA2778 family cysteine peptidase [Deltaproteobacteria bacterium]